MNTFFYKVDTLEATDLFLYRPVSFGTCESHTRQQFRMAEKHS